MVAVAHPDPIHQKKHKIKLNNRECRSAGCTARRRVRRAHITFWACRSTWTPTNSTGTRTIPGSHFFSPRMSAFDLSQ